MCYGVIVIPGLDNYAAVGVLHIHNSSSENMQPKAVRFGVVVLLEQRGLSLASTNYESGLYVLSGVQIHPSRPILP